MKPLAEELFEAYFEARRNKRNTLNALRFEIQFESEVLALAEEIEKGSYRLSRSICFLVHDPVIREIFAADFRDRVVHHYVIRKINPLFERSFLPDAYACRKDKGTHYGVSRVMQQIRKCSRHYTRPCFILKLDIQGFFMNIPRPILWQKLSVFLDEKYHEPDKERILNLLYLIVHHDSSKHCVIKGDRGEWKKVPANKSLFTTAPECGLPIGNLTSQILANFYLNELDHFIVKKIAPEGYYGRYVDDFIIVHPSDRFLKDLRREIQEFLQCELKLTLHPKKIYLQPYEKGVRFLGTMIKPWRIYSQKRITGRFKEKMYQWLLHYPHWKNDDALRQKFNACLHSYLGLLKHYKTFRITEQIILNDILPVLHQDKDLILKTKLKDWVLHIRKKFPGAVPRTPKKPKTNLISPAPSPSPMERG